jgi:hypothetical protein
MKIKVCGVSDEPVKNIILYANINM